MFRLGATTRENLRRACSFLGAKPPCFNTVPSTRNNFQFVGRFYPPNASLFVAALVSADASHPRFLFAEDCTVTAAAKHHAKSSLDAVDGDERDTKDVINSGWKQFEHGTRHLTDILNALHSNLQDVPPTVRAFGYGVIGSNVTVYAAFLLARHMSRAAAPRMSMMKFLQRHFLLTVGNVRSGNWHVLVNSMFAHTGLRHLFVNSVLTLGAISLCARSLDVKGIAAVFFGGGVLGGAASVLLRSVLPTSYRFLSLGSSAGVYSLVGFLWSEDNLGLSFSQLGFFDKLLLALIAREAVGVGMYLRYGVSGTGILSFKYDHVAHLVGALTGFGAYAALRSARKSKEQTAVSDSKQ